MPLNKINFRQYRTKSVWRLCTPSACKFSVIFHKNAREYIKYSRAFLFHLTKNLTTHLSHNLRAVLPLRFHTANNGIKSSPHANILSEVSSRCQCFLKTLPIRRIQNHIIWHCINICSFLPCLLRFHRNFRFPKSRVGTQKCCDRRIPLVCYRGNSKSHCLLNTPHARTLHHVSW